MGDDKQKNEFFIIDEDPPKRKRKPSRDYAIIVFVTAILLLGIGIGAGAILLFNSRNTLSPFPNPVTSPPNIVTPFVPTPLPVRTDWQLVFHAIGDLYVVSNENKNPQRIVEQAEDPQFSPDGARIAYQRDETITTRLYISRANGSFEQSVDDEDGVMDASYTWSPDSTRLAYITAPQFDDGTRTNEAALRLVDVASGTSQTLLTNNIDFGTLYQWSPDSQTIAFIGVDLKLYLVNVVSGDVQTLTSISVHSEFLSWSADGVYISYADADGTTVYITPVIETNPSTNSNYQLEQLVSALSWSPEGQHLAFVYNTSPQLLQIVNAADVTQPQRIIVLPEGELRGGLTWRNHELYFVLVQCDESESGFSRIYAADLNTEQATEIVNAGSYNACWASSAGRNFWSISPDGTQLAYTVGSQNEASNLYLLNLVSDETTTLMTEFDVYAPAWLP